MTIVRLFCFQCINSVREHSDQVKRINHVALCSLFFFRRQEKQLFFFWSKIRFISPPLGEKMANLVELQKDRTDLLPSNDRCGVDLPHYSWGQGDTDVTVTIPFPAGTRAKQLIITITPDSLSVGLQKAPAPVLCGKLYKVIKSADSSWQIDNGVVTVTLAKGNFQYEEWWPCVVQGEPEMDIRTLRPPAKNMRDLDDGAQATVAKLMFDQEQKRKGLPTSDELKYQEALRQAGPPPVAQ